MKRMTGAEVTIRLLEQQGISMIAGIPGGANLPLYDALSRSTSITHVLSRHEQGAGFIAQGMARASGKPAVCFATSGPGATNILTAIADAKLDSVPIICITGQVPTSLIGTDAFQEVDTYGMSIPITKHNFLVRTPEELLHVLPEAFRLSVSGRPGPVLIDIPRDVQTAELAVETWPALAEVDPAPEFMASSIEKAAEMINKAKRPVLWIGGGVVAGESGELVRAIAEKASIPVTTTLMGLGVMPNDHPLFLGMLGMHAERCTNMALEGCDCILAAGVRFDDRATGKIQEFCPDAGVVHIDIDHSEIDKLRTASVGILGDVQEVLSSLLPKIVENPREEWQEYLLALRKVFPPYAPQSGGWETPQQIIRRIGEIAGENVVVCTDVGKHQMWTAQSYPFCRDRQWLTSGGLGTMGFGLPAAIGAALATPESRVLCFSGDGSLLMNMQEFATAVEQHVNITVFLLNNNGLGLVHQQQELFFNANYFASDFSTSVDYVSIAKGFGWQAFDLTGMDEASAEEALLTVLQIEGPSLVHIPVCKEENVFPMVPPGAANRTMIEGDSHA